MNENTKNQRDGLSYDDTPMIETAELEGQCAKEILSKLEDYVKECKISQTAKTNGRFPNLAGFCRYLGLGLDKLEESLKDSREIYGAVCAIFEDEALNSPLSATVISAYLKQRLGWGDKQEQKKTSLELPEIKLVFDHDIFEDGG